MPVIPNFANPMQFICSSIQAGSRLGYQESAELCAQYLAPILDAIKFNYLPFGVNMFSTGVHIAQVCRLLRGAAAPAAGVQGHHRARDLVARHAVLVRQPRAGLDRRAGHAGCAGAAVHREHADPRFAGRTDGRAGHRGAGGTTAFGPEPLAGAPNAYDENNPLPPPWYPARPAAATGLSAWTAVRRRRGSAAGRNRRHDRARGWAKRRGAAAVLLVTAVVLASCGWHGIANVPMPGGPGTGRNYMTIYVQMPDTLALNANSRVTVADVYVGTVRGIELKNWVATLTLDLQPDRQAAGERDSPRSARPPAGHAARGAGRAAEPVAAAVAQRRHHPAEECVGVPDHRADAGQHLDDAARRRHPEPGDHPDRGQQHPRRARRPDPRFSGPAGHLHRRTEQADATTSSTLSTRPTACCPSWPRATTPWTKCSPTSRR